MREGTLVAGRFEVHRLAGAGGMGTVYRAIDQLTREAPRRARGQAPPELAAAASGAGAHARGRAPAHVTTSRTARATTAPRLAMEWLEGVTLDARLQEGAPRGRRAARRAPDRGGARRHPRDRDHAPRSRRATCSCATAGSTAVLLDFGVAPGRRRCDLLVTEASSLVGSLGYVAPEQARGDVEVDRARTSSGSASCSSSASPGSAPSRPTTRSPRCAASSSRRRRASSSGARTCRPSSTSSPRASGEGPGGAPRGDRPRGGGRGSRTPRRSRARPARARGRRAGVGHGRRAALVSVASAFRPRRSGRRRPGAGERSRRRADRRGPRRGVRRRARAAPAARAWCSCPRRPTRCSPAAAARGDGRLRPRGAPRASLALKARLPGRPVALATGRAQVGERLPAGDVIDRAVARLGEAEATCASTRSPRASRRRARGDRRRPLVPAEGRARRHRARAHALRPRHLVRRARPRARERCAASSSRAPTSPSRAPRSSSARPASARRASAASSSAPCASATRASVYVARATPRRGRAVRHAGRDRPRGRRLACPARRSRRAAPRSASTSRGPCPPFDDAPRVAWYLGEIAGHAVRRPRSRSWAPPAGTRSPWAIRPAAPCSSGRRAVRRGACRRGARGHALERSAPRSRCWTRRSGALGSPRSSCSASRATARDGDVPSASGARAACSTSSSARSASARPSGSSAACSARSSRCPRWRGSSSTPTATPSSSRSSVRARGGPERHAAHGRGADARAHRGAARRGAAHAAGGEPVRRQLWPDGVRRRSAPAPRPSRSTAGSRACPRRSSSPGAACRATRGTTSSRSVTPSCATPPTGCSRTADRTAGHRAAARWLRSVGETDRCGCWPSTPSAADAPTDGEGLVARGPAQDRGGGGGGGQGRPRSANQSVNGTKRKGAKVDEQPLT